MKNFNDFHTTFYIMAPFIVFTSEWEVSLYYDFELRTIVRCSMFILGYFRFHLKESSLDSSKISQLTVHHTVPEDSGKYVCIAANPFGNDETVLHLPVQGIIYWQFKVLF